MKIGSTGAGSAAQTRKRAKIVPNNRFRVAEIILIFECSCPYILQFCGVECCGHDEKDNYVNLLV